MQTVVETSGYLAAARNVLSVEDRSDVVDLVARNPRAGVSLGGGVRKVRIGTSGRGKRGGARVVFLFARESIPVFLLTVFAKSEKSDLDPDERASLIATGKRIVDNYGRGR